jgi:hypothetical protein
MPLCSELLHSLPQTVRAPLGSVKPSVSVGMAWTTVRQGV